MRGAMNGGFQDLTVTAALAGWITPNARDWKSETGSENNSYDKTPNLSRQVLVGWVSPTATDGSRGNLPPRPHDTGVPLDQMAALAGWATPTSRDHFPAHSQEYVDDKKAQGHGMANLNDQAALLISGPTSTSSTASTEKRGALNPDFTRWLMGYPVEWLFAAPVKSTGTRGRARSGDSATP
jgi:hypothetical protein